MTELIIAGICSVVMLFLDLKHYYEDYGQVVTLDILLIIFIVVAIVGTILFINGG